MGCEKILQNANVRLRALEPSDIDLLFEWENDTDNWLISNIQCPFSRNMLERYIESSAQDIFSARQLRLMIDTKGRDSRTVGIIDLFDFDPIHLRAGVGILVEKSEQHLGYGRESLGVLIEYCRVVLYLHQLYATVMDGNKAALGLFETSGFEKTGVRRQWVRTGYGWVDEWMLQKII